LPNAPEAAHVNMIRPILYLPLMHSPPSHVLHLHL
jgi:hypothetical protein